MKRALSFDNPEDFHGELVARFPDDKIFVGTYQHGRLVCYEIPRDGEATGKRWTFSLMGLELAGAESGRVER